MTTQYQAPASPARASGPGTSASWTGVLRSEWTKIRSVQSTMWSLAAYVVVAIGFSTIVATVLSSVWDRPKQADSHVQLHVDPTGVLFGSGFFLAQLALCVLGAMVMTSEYSTGAIRSSLLAVPGRVPMLAAKAVVFAALTFVVSAVTVFAIFFITTAILSSHITITLGQPGVLRATFGAIVYLTVLGLFALAIGGIIRHTAGAITTVIGVVLVVPIIVSLIPGTVANHIHGYLPSVAGALAGQTVEASGDVLSPWQGLGVFVLETAILLGVAAWMLKRRDA
jgi:ABC-type transport system involved in multi-copper enzyme maturation permease subunit